MTTRQHTPDLLSVVKLGVAMREAQRAYFKNRTQERLVASKQAEKAFDAAARAAIERATGGAS
jgi:hypothetical protein